MLNYWLHNANDLEVFDAFQRSLLHRTDGTTFQRSLTTQHRRPFKGHFFRFQLVHSICCLITCIRCSRETGPKGLELCLQHVFAFAIPFFMPEWASYFKNWPFIFLFNSALFLISLSLLTSRLQWTNSLSLLSPFLFFILLVWWYTLTKRMLCD
jgi:hypothetical protein